MERITIVDIGCGWNKFSGRSDDEVIGIDLINHSGVDFVLDLSTNTLPFADNSIDMVYSSHLFEHLTYDQRDHVIFGVRRILKQGGLFFLKVPHYSHFWQTAYDHYIHNYGVCTVYTLANANWYSKNIPYFHVIGVGLNYRAESFTKILIQAKIINRLLNISHRLSEMYLSYVFGGVQEVQYLLMKPFDV